MSRNRKTTKSQMEILVNFLENNRIMVTGKTHPLQLDTVKIKWTELTNILNNVESGARKDEKQWKTFLYEWKSKTKKKARIHRVNISATGGGGYTCNELNELENRLMALYGWVHVIGCPGAPEEVDPDDEVNTNINFENLDLTTRTPTPEVPINTILMAYDEDLNPIINMEPETRFLPSEPETRFLPSEPETRFLQSEPANYADGRKTGAVRKPPQGRKKAPQANGSNLERAAQSYSESTEQMTVAVKEMAKAISQLADSISKIAEVLKNAIPKPE